MRIVITLQPPEQGALVPIQYNHLVQGAIYQALPPDDQAFFHDQGFVGGGRQFKLFTFSRLFGRYEQTTFPVAQLNRSDDQSLGAAPAPPPPLPPPLPPSLPPSAQPQAAAGGEPGPGHTPALTDAPAPTPTRALRFTGPVRLVIASPAIKFTMSLVTGLLQKGHVRIGSVRFAVASVAPEQGDPLLSAARPPLGEADLVTAKVQAMSPIVVYSTLLRPEGRPYTVYYQPGDPDWTPLVDGNLRNKYQALYGQGRPPVAVDQLPPITVQVFDQPRLSVMHYKSTVIKGYTARLRLTGPLALIRLALDAGLGGKNSQGFGCLQLLGPVEPVVNRKPATTPAPETVSGGSSASN